MKVFKEIFARIWALWGLISFLITFSIIFIPSMCCYLIPGKKGQDIFIAIARVWMRIWLPLIGCNIKVIGTENFKKGEAYIVTYNHNALLDVPLSAPFVPGGNKTIAKTSFAKIPLFGWFYKKGSVLVDRKSDKSKKISYDEMKKVLEEGMHMCIYPEGTRNRTNEPLKKFYDGAFKLATDTKTSIIPSLIFNTKKAMPLHKTFYLLPHRLEIHFLPPVNAINMSSDALKQKVFEIMYNYYEANK
jgi:1-acyl-sn-glycerol-3-phosphate acyltransferase